MLNYQYVLRVLIGVNLLLSCSVLATEFAITIDDPLVAEKPYYDSVTRDKNLLMHLDRFDLKAALFVCGMRVDNTDGTALLKRWDKAGHLIANHTYSHTYYHSSKVSFQSFADDTWRVHNMIKGYKQFEPLFRFPYLKRGDTLKKRDQMRQWLKEKGYRHGYVTIDASDWYISDRLEAKLIEAEKTGTKVDLEPYKTFYLAHLWDRAQYYDKLAKTTLKYAPKHNILLHHNLLNALFLDDVIAYFKQQGWQAINAKKAFSDPLYAQQPDILPSGESILWGLAKAQGHKNLRYPAEDGRYLKEDMDQLGL